MEVLQMTLQGALAMPNVTRQDPFSFVWGALPGLRRMWQEGRRYAGSFCQHPFPSRLQAAPAGKSSVKNSSASKLIRPSSVRKHGIPMDPLALMVLKAGDESRSRRNSFRFLTCSPMSISWKSGLPESFAFTRWQSGQVDITYTLVMVKIIISTMFKDREYDGKSQYGVYYVS